MNRILWFRQIYNDGENYKCPCCFTAKKIVKDDKVA